MSSKDSDPRLPKVDELLDGKYHILRILGEGGMGVVYEAMHKRLRHRVAIKTILPRLLSEPGFVERFEREARAASQIHGPNVAKVIDVDILPNGLPYIVMEYLEGHDLATELRDRGRLPVEEAVGFVLDACQAMEEAHAMGIVHRDLKPSNLYLCADQGRRIVKVLDFGISKMTSDSDSGMTATQTTIGTPLYMSPEQIRSAKRVDGRTDIWALGVILYEAIAGRPPFSGSPTAVAASIVADEPEPLATFRSEVPPELAAVVHRALAKDMNARFQDVAELKEALAPFVVEGWRPIALEKAASRRVITGSGLSSSTTSGEAATQRASHDVLTPVERAPTTPAGFTPATAARSVTTAAPFSSQRPQKQSNRSWMTALAIVVPIVLGGVYLATRGTSSTPSNSPSNSSTVDAIKTIKTADPIGTAPTIAGSQLPAPSVSATTSTSSSGPKPPTTISKPTTKTSVTGTATKPPATATIAPPPTTAPTVGPTEPPIHI